MMKISRNSVVRLFIFALFFTPYYLFSFSFDIQRVLYLLRGGVSVYFVVKLLLRYRKNRISNNLILLFVLIALFYGVLVVSTVVNGGPLIELIAQTVTAVGFAAAALCYFSSDKAMLALNELILWLEITAIVNLITVLLFPEGLYVTYGYGQAYSNPGYFFGHRNNAIETLIPLMGLACYKDLFLHRKRSVHYWFIIALSSLTSILTWSVNAILCVGVIVGIEILLLIRDKWGFLKVRVLFWGVTAFSCFITAFSGINYFFRFFENVLNKSHTLNERIRIWGRAIIAISQKPWFGYGAEDYDVKYLRIGHSNSTHNYILDYIYYGGIVLFIVVVLIFQMVDKVVRNQADIINAKISAMFGSYFVLWLGTPIHRNQLFYMFGFIIITVSLPWQKLNATKPIS